MGICSRGYFSVLLFFICLPLTVFSAITLRIVPETKTTQQTKIAANFIFDPHLKIEVLNGGARITKGTDSDLEIYVTSDPQVELSADSNFTLINGIATFPGSIAEITNSTDIKLQFHAVSSVGLIDSDQTNAFNVTDEIHLALFHKNSRYHVGRYEEFMRDNIETINAGRYESPSRMLFPGRTLHMKSYYFPAGSPGSAMKAFLSMEGHHKANPEKKAHGIIGFANNEISKIMLPHIMYKQYSVTAYVEDSITEFADKTKYPYFNRVGYADDIMDYSFAIYLKERNWNKIVIIQSISHRFTPEFYTYTKNLGIDVVQEYVVPVVTDLASEPYGKLDEMYKAIKNSGIHIIVTPAQGDTSILIYTEAIRMSVTCTDGYQWIGYKNQDDFPKTNAPANCHRDTNSLCVLRFKGMTFVDRMYMVDGWDTDEWNKIWNNWLNGDCEKSLGHTRDFPLEDPGSFGSIFALSRDVLSANVLAMERLINAKKTISGPNLAKEIRENTDFHGLTGQVTLDPVTGERLNYIARVSHLWPNLNYYAVVYEQEKVRFGYIDWWDWYHMESMNTITLFTIKDTNSTEIVEFRTQGGPVFHKRSIIYNDPELLYGYMEIDQKFKNKRSYKAYKGFWDYAYQMQVAEDNKPYKYHEPIPKEVETRVEYVPAPFYCMSGCGGNVTDPTNINLFENGECVRQDVCSCNKDGTGFDEWTGPTCEVAVCHAGCEKGSCNSPGVCACLPGWKGVDCSQAICSSCSAGGFCSAPEICVCNPGRYGSSCQHSCTCKHGTCNEGLTGDGTCSECNSGYTGANCDISLAALIIPTILGIIALGAALYFGVKFFLKRLELKAALLNNDWIVNWTDIKKQDETARKSSMFLSAMSMNKNTNRKEINTGVWEGMDIHYQKIEKDSFAITDDIRLEVKAMREMRHINIAVFVGCVVEAPNVCILTELQPKGSLDDILCNDDIKVPWNFRFSLLKGVMAGLQYIHSSEIKSHGRLKSSNILVDNRWTVKLSGFGLQEFKANQKNVGAFNPHVKNEVDLNKSNYDSLLWTAPEILQTGVYHLDHVGRGTTENDIYSLGMVMSELCTRDVPFTDVLLEKDEIIGLICGEKDPAALKIWNDYLAKLNVEAGGWVRPCIKDKEWPTRYEKRKAFKKLMEQCWHGESNQRPSLKECINEVERIEPQKGELMDHLVKMLEKYSSNLEDIVNKRTKQLAKEKQKTEDLVSRLLPKSVAEDLKQGKRVEPENFDFVTIYFSDIVGFTSIAKASTPLEVVGLLNDMYTCFDTISANYDVYKVETIGDAYMIVSGLPTRNGDLHAGEICTTALDLMNAVGTFKIAHLPDTKLHLRAGIHTGLVVAGVVGLKMPRYCLFGESVNAASKMESTGTPLRIQISDDTYTILERLGGYHCEYRTKIELKGKGMVNTYWLNGKDGYDKKLPDWTQVPE